MGKACHSQLTPLTYIHVGEAQRAHQERIDGLQADRLHLSHTGSIPGIVAE